MKAHPIFALVPNQMPRLGVSVRSMLNCNGRMDLRRKRFEIGSGQTDVSVDALIDKAACEVFAGMFSLITASAV